MGSGSVTKEAFLRQFKRYIPTRVERYGLELLVKPHLYRGTTSDPEIAELCNREILLGHKRLPFIGPRDVYKYRRKMEALFTVRAIDTGLPVLNVWDAIQEATEALREVQLARDDLDSLSESEIGLLDTYIRLEIQALKLIIDGQTNLIKGDANAAMAMMAHLFVDVMNRAPLQNDVRTKLIQELIDGIREIRARQIGTPIAPPEEVKVQGEAIGFISGN